MWILTHDDFDGLASAALLLAWLRRTRNVLAEDAQLMTVDYNQTLQWDRPAPAGLPAEPFAVLDFMYHPEALFWFDHHPDALRTDADELHFAMRQERGDPLVVWDPTQPSCARLVFETLPGLEDLAPIVEGADLVDRAQYPSPDAFYRADHPATKLTHAHPFLSEGQKTELVARMLRHGLEAACDFVRPEIFMAMERNYRALQQYETAVRFQNDVVIMDLVPDSIPFVRFAGYWYYPNAKYALTIFRAGEVVRVQLSKNPWLDEPYEPLNAYAREVGGGGHAFAAGASFLPTDHRYPYSAAVSFVNRVARELASVPLDQAA